MTYSIVERPTSEYPIDITIFDGPTQILKAYAPAENIKDITIECSHPEIEFTDSNADRGTCPICGAECDWNWDGIDDEGHRERIITDWHEELSPSPDSILGKALYNA